MKKEFLHERNSICNEIASVVSLHRNDKTRSQQNVLASDKKTENLHKTQFSKIKIHLKLSCESVGQGRGGLEGTVRPSQLRAGYPPKKRITK